jgi:hypothetical protein
MHWRWRGSITSRSRSPKKNERCARGSCADASAASPLELESIRRQVSRFRIAVHVLFGIVAGVRVVQRYQTQRKLTFKGGPPSPNPSTRALEHKVQMAKRSRSGITPATD